jgi:hypothetical protein
MRLIVIEDFRYISKANIRTVLLFILGVEFLKYSYIVIKNENYQFNHRGCLLIPESEYELDKRFLKK